MKAQLAHAMQNGQVLAQRLASLNPDKILLRGYALVLGAAKQNARPCHTQPFGVGQTFGLFTQQGMIEAKVIRTCDNIEADEA